MSSVVATSPSGYLKVQVLPNGSGSLMCYRENTQNIENTQIIVIFDTSGSMRNHSIEASKKLISCLSNKYSETTKINIITFASVTRKYTYTLKELQNVAIIHAIFKADGSTLMKTVPDFLFGILISLNPELPILIIGVSDGDIFDQSETTDAFNRIKSGCADLQITVNVVRLFTSRSQPATHALALLMSFGNGQMTDIPYDLTILEQIRQFGDIINDITVGSIVKVKTNEPFLCLSNGSIIKQTDMKLSRGQIFYSDKLITPENILECPCEIVFGNIDDMDMSLLEMIDTLMRKFLVLNAKSVQLILPTLYIIFENLISHYLILEEMKKSSIEPCESGSYLDSVRKHLLKNSQCGTLTNEYKTRLHQYRNINKTDLISSEFAAHFLQQKSAVVTRAAKKDGPCLDDVFRGIVGKFASCGSALTFPTPDFHSFMSLMGFSDMIEIVLNEHIFTETLDNLLQIIGGLGICVHVDKTAGTADPFKLVVMNVCYGLTASEADVCNAIALQTQLKTFGSQIFNAVVPTIRMMGKELHELYFRTLKELAKLHASISIRGAPVPIDGDIPARVVCVLIHLLKNPEPTEIYHLYVDDLVGELKYFMNSNKPVPTTSYDKIAAYMTSPINDPRSVWISNIATVSNILAIMIGNKFCDPLTTDSDLLINRLVYLYEFDMYNRRRDQYRKESTGDYCDDRIRTEGISELLHFLGFSSMATLKELATSFFNCETGTFNIPDITLNFDRSIIELPEPAFYISVGKIINNSFDEIQFLKTLNEQLQIIYVNTLIGYNQRTRVTDIDSETGVATVVIASQMPPETHHDYFTDLLMKYLTPEMETIHSNWKTEQEQKELNEKVYTISILPFREFAIEYNLIVPNRSSCGYKTMLKILDDITRNIPDRILKMNLLMCGLVSEFPDCIFSNRVPCDIKELSDYKILFDKIYPVTHATGADESIEQCWTKIVAIYNAVPKGYRPDKRNRHGHGTDFASYGKSFHGQSFSNVYDFALACERTNCMNELFKYMYNHRKCCNIQQLLMIDEYYHGFHSWKQINLTDDAEKMREPIPAHGHPSHEWLKAKCYERSDKHFFTKK